MQTAPPADSTALPTLLDEAEQALALKQLAAAQALAERAWALSAGAGAPGALRVRAGRLLATVHYRTGALAATLAVGLELLPLLREAVQAEAPADPSAEAFRARRAELIDLLRMCVLCGADTSRFEQALAHAREAHALALAAEDTARISLSLNALAVIFERSGDPWQAERLMLEALAIARRQSEPHPVFVNLNNLSAALIAKFYMLRDGMPLAQAQAALHTALPFIEEAVAMGEQMADPFLRTMPRGNLGEVLVHLGRADEAEHHLQQASALAAQHGFGGQVWRMRCSFGELALLRGEPERAWQLLHEVLAHPGTESQPILHLRLHHALWRAAGALGRPEAALQHLEAYLRIERARSLTQLRAQSELFVTRMEAEQLHQEGQRQRLRAMAAEAAGRRDPLTGLANRRELERRWPELLAQAAGAPLSVAMLDLDHFKLVNDRHGHAAGDAVLVALAQLLRQGVRSRDLVVRMGGEEFLLVLPDADAAQAHEACQRLCQSIAAHDWSGIAPALAVTASIGVATTAAPAAHETTALIESADAALYRAKAAGRNGVVSH